jgi:hypothetical protein
VRLADGVVVERILPPAFARQMFVTPDGTALVGIANQDGVFVIDLR